MEFFEKLEKSLNCTTPTFACGGTVVSRPIADYDNRGLPLDPVIYYDNTKGQPQKICFPTTVEEVEKLASNCDLASFGVGTEERIDLDYRSAQKLDPSKFATSFHPNNTDIMETIKQLLFPGTIYISAELYKLNVWPLSDSL